MAQKVRKAVIPAAGLGTRVLPISKAMPKEMLPIVDKPAIQYIVEEAVASGIEDILIITNRGKGIIEDHFDHMVELEQRLAASGRQETLDQLNHITGLANIYFIRQKETKGLGHAVNCARSFVGNEPFAVLYGDDVIIGEDPACGQLCRAFRPVTDENDFQTKLRSLVRFLNDGDKAKVTLRYRGREMAHQQFGMELMDRIRTELAEVAQVEHQPKLEGRQMIMVLAPKKKK